MRGLIKKESPIFVIDISFLLTNFEENEKNHLVEDNVNDVTTMYGSQ